jgi:Ulp1 family protease
LFTLERNSSNGSGDLLITNSLHGYNTAAFENIAQRIQQFAIDASLCSIKPKIRIRNKACQQLNGYDCGLFTINFLRMAVFRPNDPFPSEFQYSRMNFAVDLLNLNTSISIV